MAKIKSDNTVRNCDKYVVTYHCGINLHFPDGFLGSSDGKDSACNAGDLGLIPGSGRSPGEGHGSPLQYSCLENSMDRGAWQATAHGSQRVGHD